MSERESAGTRQSMAACRNIAYLMTFGDNVPEDDDWLGPRELARQALFRVPKRRREWRLGRWIAKRILGSWRQNVPMSRLEVVAADDGAPEAYEGSARLPLTISITHRANIAVCAVAEASCALGCDLELIEHRSDRFVADFFTTSEQEQVRAASPATRDWLAALIWSAKESALKALRTGLRRDTRTVEVDIPRSPTLLAGPDPDDTDGATPNWQPMSVFDREADREFVGWWWRQDRLLLTTVCSPPARLPIALDRGRPLELVLAEAREDEDELVSPARAAS